MIRETGYFENCIWEHSATVRELYARRCRREEIEMDSAAQAAELLQAYVRPSESVLDAGCGSGYLFHSLRDRGILNEYTGIDASPTLIGIGQAILPEFGLPKEHLHVLRIEDLAGSFDHIVCLNVLSNIDNYHKPLERLLKTAKRSVILRESVDDQHMAYAYVKDQYLDPKVDLKVYVNTYPLREVVAFIESYGYNVELVTDKRTRGKVEFVIGYPHYWKFLVARKQ